MSQDSLENQRLTLQNMNKILLQYRDKTKSMSERIDGLKSKIDIAIEGKDCSPTVKNLTDALLKKSLSKLKSKSARRMGKWQYDAEIEKVSRHVNIFCKYIDKIDIEIRKYETKNIESMKTEDLVIMRGILELYHAQSAVYMKSAKKIYNSAVERMVEEEMYNR